MARTRMWRPHKSNFTNKYGDRVYKTSYYYLIEEVNKANKRKDRTRDKGKR